MTFSIIFSSSNCLTRKKACVHLPKLLLWRVCGSNPKPKPKHIYYCVTGERVVFTFTTEWIWWHPMLNLRISYFLQNSVRNVCTSQKSKINEKTSCSHGFVHYSDSVSVRLYVTNCRQIIIDQINVLSTWSTDEIRILKYVSDYW